MNNLDLRTTIIQSFDELLQNENAFNIQRNNAADIPIEITPINQAFTLTEATRIYSNVAMVKFQLNVGDNVAPAFMVAYGCFRAMQVALRRMRQRLPRHTVRMTKSYFRIGMRAVGDPNPIQPQRGRGTTLNLLDEQNGLLNLNRFTIPALEMLQVIVANLLSIDYYDDELQGVLENIGYFIQGNQIQVQSEVFIEVIAFYRVIRNRGTVDLNNPNVQVGRRAENLQIRDHIQLVRDFGGKRKMFYRGNEVQFHSECKQSLDCLGFNPLMDGEHCFPMAFLCSQVREYNFDGENIQERRSNPLCIKTLSQRLDSYPYLRIPYHGDPIDEFTRGQQLFIFNPIQPSYPIEWEKAAKVLHAHVELQKDEIIDHTSWDSCPQAYADVFQVVIHIFLKDEKTRFDVYTPKEKTNPARHIYMYCDKNHFQPVLDIRFFTNSKSINHLSYCDYCQKSISPKSAKERKEDHIKKCHDLWKFTSHHVQEFLIQTEREPAPPVKATRELIPYCKTHGCLSCQCEEPKQNMHTYECTVCGYVGTHLDLSYQHRCYFVKPEPKEIIQESKLFVLDIESLQRYDATADKYAHECVLMCFRNVYNADLKYEVTNIAEFIHMLRSFPEFEQATFIAHNGGGYDYQFIIAECEKSNIEFNFVPRPSSDHKYISLTLFLENHTVTFIDFMCLIPGSLKGIAQSFQLEVQKGDFPHRFLNQDTLHYVGRLPPLHTPEDYYSLKWKKSEKDVLELSEWFAEQSEKYCTCEDMCTCTKLKWNCFQFLKEYCWIDVHVLANACQKYRSLLLNVEPTGGQWNPTPIDPFQYLTQSQLAMQIFLSGFAELPPIGITIPRRPRGNLKRFAWFHRLQVRYPQWHFIHLGTNALKYVWLYGMKAYECYCVETRTIYEFVSEGEQLDTDELNDMVKMGFINNYIVCHERDLSELNSYETELIKLSNDRDFFFGGRTEVFSPYAKPHESEEIKYLDVCSLYPTMCSFAMLPTGHPQMLFGKQCLLDRLNPRHEDPYFGFVRCRVVTNKKDLLGLLPHKMENGKLVFDVRDKVGMWFTEEIYLAMQEGYTVVEIYEVHHFDEQNRSDKLMRGYMESFLQLKQESEGWKKLGASSDDPNDEEKDKVVQAIFESNGNIGKVRKDKVKKNPVLRQVSKIFLNCLWGKFCQRQKADYFTELTSYQDYECLMEKEDLEDMVFRQMNGGRWRVKFTKPSHLLPYNRRYNIYLAAAVTAQARCYLHRQMLNIGPERVLYCDTDSIVFLYPKNAPSLTGIGLGKWTDEHPNEVISEFFALAPKCYMLNIEEDLNIKAKGCIMSLENQKKLHRDKVIHLIESYCVQKSMESVNLQNFSIFTNSNDINYSYGTMFSRYNHKQVRCVLNKRVLVTEYGPDEVLGETIKRVTLLPDGYEID
jgi:hypothetical protein